MFPIKFLSVVLVGTFYVTHFVFAETNVESLSVTQNLGKLSSSEIRRAFVNEGSLRRQKRSQPTELHNVTIHNSPNFDGEKFLQQVPKDGCVTWRGGDHWNDNISAIILHGYCVRAWAYEDCTGYSTSLCFTSAKKLNEIMMTPWRSWDNEITSFSGWAYKAPPASVFLYDQQDLRGNSIKQILLKENCVNFFQGDSWNDRTSSVSVTSGCVEFFVDAFCRGSSFKVTNKNENYVGSSFDKKISSIISC